MTPKEKAEELVIGFLKVELPSDGFMLVNIAKQCALIAVDEILKTDLFDSCDYSYWENVKHEINLL